jgi:ELWxxDGT repeat protein
MGTVGGRAWLSALALMMGGSSAFAQGVPGIVDPVSVRRLADLADSQVLTPEHSAIWNGRLYFLTVPSSGAPRSKLWSTDGTAAGTREHPMPASVVIDPASLRATSQRLFFTATVPVTGRALWTSDGTMAGTHVTGDVAEGGAEGAVAAPAELFVLSDHVLFTSGSDGDLWRSDGTEAGTLPVKDILPGEASSHPRDFVRVGDTVFFTARGPEGRELWRTDGTEEGTTLVRDLRPGAEGSDVRALTAVGATLYFVADDGQHGVALWKSDGTPEGTTLVALPTVAGAAPAMGVGHLTALDDGRLVFVVIRSDSLELWGSDGTDAGTARLKALPQSSIEGPPGLQLIRAGARVYLLARGSADGDALWVTDGTEAGTAHVPLPFPRRVQSLRLAAAWDGALTFVADTALNRRELFRTDGTVAGTYKLARLPLGERDAAPTALLPFQGGLLLETGDAWTRHGLWRLEADAMSPTFECPDMVDVPSTGPDGASLEAFTPALHGGQAPLTTRTTLPVGMRLGLHQVREASFQATDALGRVASCDLQVRVLDSTGPAIQGCPTALTLDTASPLGLAFRYPALSVTDETDPDVRVSHSPENGSILPVGTTRVTMTATDRSGNVSTCAFPVTVRTSLPSSGACQVREVRVEAEGPEGAHASWPEPDGVSAQVVSRTHAPGDLFPLGATRVQLTSTDETGSTRTCEIQVRVRDSRPPMLTCPASFTVRSAVMSGIRAEYPAATAHDAVSEVEISYSPEPGTPLSPGDHWVQVTAMDAAGNAALCTFQLAVEYDPTSDMRRGLGCATGGTSGAAGLGALLVLAWTLAGRRKGGTPRA